MPILTCTIASPAVGADHLVVPALTADGEGASCLSAPSRLGQKIQVGMCLHAGI